MAAFLDACRFNPAAGGTTDWTYSSPVPGYQTPTAAGAVNGRLYKYRAESADLSQWELGEGAYNSGTGAFARTTVLFNSSGTTSKINFATVPQVAIVALKEDLISIEEVNNFTETQKMLARSNLYAAPFDAVAYGGLQVNGSMEVSQERGTTAVTGIANNGYHIVDGYMVSAVGTMVVTAQQVGDAPPGLTNSIRITVATAQTSLGANDYTHIRHKVEGYRSSRLAFGGASAQPLSIGFWTKIHRTGIYSGTVRNASGDRTCPFSFTQNVADTWEYKTVTIAGDTTGTWTGNTNGTGLDIFFCTAVGSSLTSSANTWAASNYIGVTGTTNGVAATSDVFQITGVCILPGIELPSSSRAPFIMRAFETELLLCKRYWRKSYGYGIAPGTATGEGLIECQLGGTTSPLSIPVSFSPECGRRQRSRSTTFLEQAEKSIGAPTAKLPRYTSAVRTARPLEAAMRHRPPNWLFITPQGPGCDG